MSNIALYRKYRPVDIDQLIGQSHIAASLQNALKQGRISHAYLFTGPRGVGKTSTARILARRANKLDPNDTNAQLDIIEIDGASNRRIDEIRELREKVHLAPAQGQYKIYIIDEVHMLTTEAFNALLKTLEEPPAHVIFILATTEPHKLPETIISRTQRYSFRPVTSGELAAHLAKVAKSEKISISPQALEIIAQSADGSVRDGLSILDQAANLTAKRIEADDINELLGLSDHTTLEHLSRAILEQDSKKTLEIIDSYKTSGGSSVQLLQQLLRLLHSVLRIKIELVKARTEGEHWLAEQPTSRLIELTKQLANLVQNSPYLDFALEAKLIELASAADGPQPADIPVVKVAAAKKSVTQKAPAASEPKPSSAKYENSSFNETIWPKVLTVVKNNNNSLYALLRSAVVGLSTDALSVEFRFQFHRRRLEEARNIQILKQALLQVTGKPIDVEVSVNQGRAAEPSTQQAAQQDREAIDNVLQILGGEVIS